MTNKQECVQVFYLLRLCSAIILSSALLAHTL